MCLVHDSTYAVTKQIYTDHNNLLRNVELNLEIERRGKGKFHPRTAHEGPEGE